MSIWDKIRIKVKIHKLCYMMRKRMNKEDVEESAETMLDTLHRLPQDKKEGLLDAYIEVLKNGG